MVGGSVFRKGRGLTKPDALGKQATGLARAVQLHGKERLSLEGGCCVKTIENAMAGRSLLELHTALNIVAFEPTAGDELLADYGLGLHVIDVDSIPDGQAMAALAELLAEYAKALADGKRQHSETLKLADLITQLLPWMHGITAQARKIRG